MNSQRKLKEYEGGHSAGRSRALKKWRKEINSLQAFIVTVFSKAQVYTLHKLKGSTKDQALIPLPRLFP